MTVVPILQWHFLNSGDLPIVVAGLKPEDVVEAVGLATRLPFHGRYYEFEEDFSPANVRVMCYVAA